MSNVSGTAIYRKRAGTITVFEDEQPPKLSWKCIDSSVANPLIEVQLDKIATLQATPATSEKMMLRIGLSSSSENEAASTEENKEKPKNDLTFAFNNRVTMDEIKSVLQQVIARKRSSNNAALPGDTNGKPNTGSPVPLPMSENVENDEFLASLLDSGKLLKNLTLQQRLLRDSPNLMKTFTEAVIKSGLEPDEFWSTRVHLLRSYAIQNNQKRGPYNVLSTIKPVASSENQVNVSVTREKIHEIFQQYPIVRKAYDDNVPKINEGEFWSRFFSSKLFRKLRGEKVNLYDRGDITLDKYLYFDPDYDGEEEDEDIDKLLEEKIDHKSSKEKEAASKGGKKLSKKRQLQQEKKQQQLQNEKNLTSAKKKVKLFNDDDQEVSKCIDIRGNEEDDPEKLGNTPDLTMKANQNPDFVNVMRTMNRLSRRMMSNIKDADNKGDLDHEFEEELDIKDLENKERVEYNELKYTQRSNVSTNIIPSELLEQANNQSPLNPTLNEYDAFIKSFKNQFDPEHPLELTSVYVENKKPIYETYKEISAIVKKNIKQSNQSWNSKNLDSGFEKQDAEVELSTDKLNNLRLTHSTSIEFLRHFWLHFNSISSSSMQSNPNFKAELIQLRKLYFSVSKCLERVSANLKEMESKDKATGDTLLAPLVDSLKSALSNYEAVMVESK